MVSYHIQSQEHSRWQAKYNDGHSFIQGCGEHLFAQLYAWAVCCNRSTKLGMDWEQSLLCREQRGQQINVQGAFLFWFMFTGQCTVYPYPAPAARLQHAESILWHYPTLPRHTPYTSLTFSCSSLELSYTSLPLTLPGNTLHSPCTSLHFPWGALCIGVLVVMLVLCIPVVHSPPPWHTRPLLWGLWVWVHIYGASAEKC